MINYQWKQDLLKILIELTGENKLLAEEYKRLASSFVGNSGYTDSHYHHNPVSADIRLDTYLYFNTINRVCDRLLGGN